MVQVRGDDALSIGPNPPHLALRIKSAPQNGVPRILEVDLDDEEVTLTLYDLPSTTTQR
jgi:hypothetical protein